MYFLIKTIWFLLPSGRANLVPPIAAKLIPRWDTPVDFGATLRGKRLLGPHKTFRGLASGILLASITLKTQCFISTHVSVFQNLEESSAFCDLWWLGPWLGFAALTGDLFKSFLKRQFDIRPGHSWFPWDQIDWILGTLVAAYPIFKFNFLFALSAIIVGLALSST